jgi:hypothetical protein
VKSLFSLLFEPKTERLKIQAQCKLAQHNRVWLGFHFSVSDHASSFLLFHVFNPSTLQPFNLWLILIILLPWDRHQAPGTGVVALGLREEQHLQVDPLSCLLVATALLLYCSTAIAILYQGPRALSLSPSEVRHQLFSIFHFPNE